MKKLALYAAVFLVLVMATVASARTVDDVISRATAAMGGQSAIDAVRSLEMNMTGTYLGKAVGMEMAILKPDCKLIGMNLMGMEIVSATDGADYWSSRSGQVVDMPAAAKEQFGSSFNQYCGAGIADLIGNGTFTYVGTEEVNGVDADVVEGVITGSGGVSIYFDPEGLPFRILMPNDDGELDMYITDYRDVGGMKMAYKYESFTNGTPDMALQITTVDVNSDLDVTTFTRPGR